MELRDFTEKFLPDFQNKLDDWNKQFMIEHKLNNIPAFASMSFCVQNFPEALQNFADRIREAQAEECAQAYESADFGRVYSAITGANRVKIEKL
jgi:hypothetical protein